MDDYHFSAHDPYTVFIDDLVKKTRKEVESIGSIRDRNGQKVFSVLSDRDRNVFSTAERRFYNMTLQMSLSGVQREIVKGVMEMYGYKYGYSPPASYIQLKESHWIGSSDFLFE